VREKNDRLGRPSGRFLLRTEAMTEISDERRREIYERYKELRRQGLAENTIVEKIEKEFSVDREMLALIVGEFRL
jgi:hypothetical protein